MYVGINHAGETWNDVTGNNSQEVVIGKNGVGEFYVQNGSHSIWVKKI